MEVINVICFVTFYSIHMKNNKSKGKKILENDNNYLR